MKARHVAGWLCKGKSTINKKEAATEAGQAEFPHCLRNMKYLFLEKHFSHSSLRALLLTY
jgi:hypothetical protein